MIASQKAEQRANNAAAHGDLLTALDWYERAKRDLNDIHAIARINVKMCKCIRIMAIRGMGL
jgi:hypothetical protein